MQRPTPFPRIAVVGAGPIGPRYIELFGESRECELAAVVDPTPASPRDGAVMRVSLAVAKAAMAGVPVDTSPAVDAVSGSAA